ncbi:MAG: hypothetical protein LBT39_08865, partial [Treponema sp.]|nr:hypothetical protein [Treponema sp.]
LEPELFGRWYFYDFGIKGGGFFVQANLGAAVAIMEKNPRPLFAAGFTGGFRLPLHKGDYYTEPYVRLGYPYLWGFGAKIGCRF